MFNLTELTDELFVDVTLTMNPGRISYRRYYTKLTDDWFQFASRSYVIHATKVVFAFSDGTTKVMKDRHGVQA